MSRTWRALLTGLLFSSAISIPVAAQITPDRTTNTIVSPIDNGIGINAGDRAGDNLFHSFEQFSVLNGSEAFFNNANDIVNIFSRVTGGDISNIDGLLRANGDANLFIINPAGIVFGEGARLDIGGSFFASTAESIVFSDDIEFSATDTSSEPLLTINQPLGLNLGNNPGEIIVRGNGLGAPQLLDRDSSNLIDTEDALRVNSSSTLGLVGGNLNLEGATLKTAGGRIELGSLAGNERVSLIPIDKGFSLGYESVKNFSDINLFGSATVDASGLVSGDIQVWGNNILSDNSIITSLTLGDTLTQEIPGSIQLNANNTINFDNISIIRNSVASGAIGNSGEITIATGDLTLNDGSQIDAGTFGEGNGGKIEITADDTITIDGTNRSDFPTDIVPSTGIGSAVFSDAVGNGGEITIATGNLVLNNEGQINVVTSGKGNAGNINITAKDTITINGANSLNRATGIASIVDVNTVGNGGEITITTDNLTLKNGGQVSASTLGEGDAGDVTVKATESILISGVLIISGLRGVRSGLSAQAFFRNGNGGDINILTDRLTIDDGGSVSVGNLDDLGFIPSGTGEPGDINIEANSIALGTEGRIVSTTQATTGDNANINLRVGNLLLRDNSTISAQALEDADGGNLTIDADSIVAFPNQNNDIIANAAQGTGGNIDITTSAIFGLVERSSTPQNNTNDIDASSEFGLDGTVAINELDVDPAEALEELPAEVIDVARLVAQNLCQQGRGSEFIVTGKGGIAPSPTQARDGEISEVDLVEPASLENDADGGELRFASTEAKPEIIEAQGWIINNRGILELVADKTDPNSSPPQPEAKICAI